jgi:hypothetical protein
MLYRIYSLNHKIYHPYWQKLLNKQRNCRPFVCKQLQQQHPSNNMVNVLTSGSKSPAKFEQEEARMKPDS